MTFVKCCSKALSFAKACSNSGAVTGRRALGVSSMGEARGVKRFLESPDDPFPDYDVSTEAAASRLISMSRPVEEPSRVRPTGVHEATLMLAAFRPAQQGVAGLRDLLEARADPNADAGPGKLSPLRKVLCLHITAMSARCDSCCSTAGPPNSLTTASAGAHAPRLT